MAADDPLLLPIRTSEDIVRMRQALRERMQAVGFTLVDQTKLVTAASELARNAMTHGRGGDVAISLLGDAGRTGIRLEFSDRGPGIEDIPLALTDGYTTANGLGLGLGGAKRLSNEFAIDSRPGAGTRVAIARWR